MTCATLTLLSSGSASGNEAKNYKLNGPLIVPSSDVSVLCVHAETVFQQTGKTYSFMKENTLLKMIITVLKDVEPSI